MKTISYILTLCLCCFVLNGCGCSGDSEEMQNSNLIGDVIPIDFTINLVDANGNNVVNDENLQKVCDFVTIIYQRNTYKPYAVYYDKNNRRHDEGLTYWKDEKTNEYEIVFHKFRGDISHKYEQFQVKWGDGTVTNVRFNNKFAIKDGKIELDWWFDVNGQTTKVLKEGTTLTKVVTF